MLRFLLGLGICLFGLGAAAEAPEPLPLGGHLSPLLPTTMELLQSDIRILVDSEKNEAVVEGRYVIHNPQSKKVRLDAGLIESPQKRRGQDIFGLTSLTTSIDQKPVRYELLDLAWPEATHWREPGVRAHHFFAQIPPRARVEVFQRARFNLPTGIPLEALRFSMKHLSMWKAVANKISIEVIHQRPHTYVQWSDSFDLVGRSESVSGAQLSHHYRLRPQAGQVKGPLVIRFADSQRARMENPVVQGGCPTTENFFKMSFILGQDSESQAAKQKRLAQKIFASHTIEELEICQAWREARHGKIFESKELNRYFYEELGSGLGSKPRPERMNRPGPRPQAQGQLHKAWFVPNSTYHRNLLTKWDRDYIQTIEYARENLEGRRQQSFLGKPTLAK